MITSILCQISKKNRLILSHQDKLHEYLRNLLISPEFSTTYAACPLTTMQLNKPLLDAMYATRFDLIQQFQN